VNLYPSRYSLESLSAFLVAHLERRRLAFSAWDAQTEQELMQAAVDALVPVRKQFFEITADEVFWRAQEKVLLTVTVPRYFQLAKVQHALEHAPHSQRRRQWTLRVAYSALGLFSALLILRTAIPDWLVPFGVFLFVFGPFVPDLQKNLGRRRYLSKIEALLIDMKREEDDRNAYAPAEIESNVSDPIRALKEKS
jgi:hypothetical protein